MTNPIKVRLLLPMSMVLLSTQAAQSEENVVIESYMDYFCHHCVKQNIQLKKLVTNTPRVTWRYRFYPAQNIPAANYAARLAWCAKNQSSEQSFWQLSDKLYSLPHNLLSSEENLDVIVKQTLPKYSKVLLACAGSQEAYTAIKQDIHAATVRYQFIGTPGLVIKTQPEKIMQGYTSFNTLHIAIKKAAQ